MPLTASHQSLVVSWPVVRFLFESCVLAVPKGHRGKMMDFSAHRWTAAMPSCRAEQRRSLSAGRTRPFFLPLHTSVSLGSRPRENIFFKNFRFGAMGGADGIDLGGGIVFREDRFVYQPFRKPLSVQDLRSMASWLTKLAGVVSCVCISLHDDRLRSFQHCWSPLCLGRQFRVQWLLSARITEEELR
jgi:hypothetical protein